MGVGWVGRYMDRSGTLDGWINGRKRRKERKKHAGGREGRHIVHPQHPVTSIHINTPILVGD